MLTDYLKEIHEGKRAGSFTSAQTLNSLTGDERETWRAVRKELEEIGVTVAAFDANKEFILAWFRRAIASGEFGEQPYSELSSEEEDLQSAQQGPLRHDDAWIVGLHATASHEQLPVESSSFRMRREPSCPDGHPTTPTFPARPPSPSTTEYDYSPEAVRLHLAQQSRIPDWVSNQPDTYFNPFSPNPSYFPGLPSQTPTEYDYAPEAVDHYPGYDYSPQAVELYSAKQLRIPGWVSGQPNTYPNPFFPSPSHFAKDELPET
jgi:hypothetical protein